MENTGASSIFISDRALLFLFLSSALPAEIVVAHCFKPHWGIKSVRLIQPLILSDFLNSFLPSSGHGTTVEWRSSYLVLSIYEKDFKIEPSSYCYLSGFGPTTMSASSTCWWITCRAASCSATYVAVGASATAPGSSIPLRSCVPSSTYTPKKSSTATWSLRTSCWTVKDTSAWLTSASLRSSLTGERSNISNYTLVVCLFTLGCDLTWT